MKDFHLDIVIYVVYIKGPRNMLRFLLLSNNSIYYFQHAYSSSRSLPRPPTNH